MPKNIVICCDGTGNEFGDSNSNVVKLCQTLIQDNTQVVYYHPGVGTMGSPNARTWLDKQWDVVSGLAFGHGITENMCDAYRFLMLTYEDGDRIFLFGFSRGAYTARALGGLLCMYGLLRPGNEGLLPYVTARFASHTKESQGMSHSFEVAEGFKKTFSRDVLLHFVGVWDTVSTVGWISDPVVIPFTFCNPIMKTGRHAVSIDEKRCFFRDNLWGPKLSANNPRFRVEQDIAQVWFPGVHCDIGGGYPEGESGLANITLHWMLTEACKFDLEIDMDKAKFVLGQTNSPFVRVDPCDGQHESLKGVWKIVEYLPHYRYDKRVGVPRWKWTAPFDRRHLPPAAVLHESVFDRMSGVPEYRPPNLPQGRNANDELTWHYEPLRCRGNSEEIPPLVRPSESSDNLRFNELPPGEKVQSILNLGTDAHPLLEKSPDVTPGFPILPVIVALVIVFSGPPLVQTWPSWKWQVFLGWLPLPQSDIFWTTAYSVGLLLIFWLVYRGFLKLYTLALIQKYEAQKPVPDHLIAAGQPDRTSNFVGPKWKAANHFTAGVVTACVVLVVLGNYLSSLWLAWILAGVALVILALGVIPAALILARNRAFTALLCDFVSAGRTHEAVDFLAAQEGRQHTPSAGHEEAASPSPPLLQPFSGSILKQLFAKERALANANAILTPIMLGAVVAFVLRSALVGPIQASLSYWVPMLLAVLAVVITVLFGYFTLAPGPGLVQELAVVRETFLDGQTTVSASAADRRKCLHDSLLY